MCVCTSMHTCMRANYFCEYDQCPVAMHTRIWVHAFMSSSAKIVGHFTAEILTKNEFMSEVTQGQLTSSTTRRPIESMRPSSMRLLMSEFAFSIVAM